jgi:FkbM family methyltransferase
MAMFNVDQDFSQYGEQRIILDFFSRCSTGFNNYCVDAGAYDGIIGSNSRALFLNGWRGVAIEPNPRTFTRLKALYADRPEITCVQRALSDTRRDNVVMKFSTGPEGTLEEDKWKYAQVSTLNNAFAASYEKDYGYLYETAEVSTDTLTNILREVRAPKDIGFLSIDCEGEDIKIIKELDLTNFCPLLICIEADDNNRHLFAGIIERQGYTLYAYTVANAFFSLKSASLTLHETSTIVQDHSRQAHANIKGNDRETSKTLEDFWQNRQYEREITYTKNLGLMLQPSSFTDFQAHPDFVEAFRLWTQKDFFRGLNLVRVWSLVLNVKQVLSKHAGSLAELGVYQGQSSALLSFYAEKFGRKIYLADTFQGFAQQQFEEDMGEGKQAAFKDVSLEAARTVVGDYAGNRWVVGMFPDSITEEMRDDTYAFVSIDCDLYEPIAEGLKFFWPRMVPGGMIFVHDYSSGHWPGATRAVDEFCTRNGIAGSLLPDFAGSYVLTRQELTHESADQAEAQLADLRQQYETLQTSLDQAQANLIRAHANNGQLNQALAVMQGSRSWRYTKPLRIAMSYLRNSRLGSR